MSISPPILTYAKTTKPLPKKVQRKAIRNWRRAVGQKPAKGQDGVIKTPWFIQFGNIHYLPAMIIALGAPNDYLASSIRPDIGRDRVSQTAS